MRNAIVISSAVLLLITCARDEPRPPAPTSSQPKWMQPEKAPVVSPAVRELLKDDPDVKRKLTPEEIKAALAAAQSQPAQKTTEEPQKTTEQSATTNTSEWQKLEAEKEAREKAYRDRLEQTTVYVAPGDDEYHAAGCEALYRVYWVKGSMIGERRMVGTAISLATAKTRGMRPHGACGAPGYEFHYQ